MRASDLRRLLKGVSDDARIVVADDDGHWTPEDAEYLPVGADGQLVFFAPPADGV